MTIEGKLTWVATASTAARGEEEAARRGRMLVIRAATSAGMDNGDAA
jgi:hypothetical protein